MCSTYLNSFLKTTRKLQLLEALLYDLYIYMEVQHINTAIGSASSNSNTTNLKQSLSTANKALSLKSTDSKTRRDLTI